MWCHTEAMTMVIGATGIVMTIVVMAETIAVTATDIVE